MLLPFSLLATVSTGVIPEYKESNFPSCGQFAADFRSTPAGNGVAISSKWVLGCAHGGGGAYFVQGKRRFLIESRIAHPKADLALWKLKEGGATFAPPLFQPIEKLKGRQFTIVGFGETGVKFPWGFDGRQRTSNVKRSATNTIDEERAFDRFSSFASQLLVYDLDEPGKTSTGTLGGKATAREGGIGLGDSGCPWYVFEAGKPRVVAITVYLLGHPKGGKQAFAWGAQGGAVHIYAYRDWIRRQTGI